MNAVFLPLIFISGVFYSTRLAAARCSSAVAEVLPLKHVIDGLSGAIVTGEGLAETGGALAVIALWGAAGLVLAVRTSAGSSGFERNRRG